MYAYGNKLSPSVGNGLGGLPTRRITATTPASTSGVTAELQYPLAYTPLTELYVSSSGLAANLSGNSNSPIVFGNNIFIGYEQDGNPYMKRFTLNANNTLTGYATESAPNANLVGNTSVFNVYSNNCVFNNVGTKYVVYNSGTNSITAYANPTSFLNVAAGTYTTGGTYTGFTIKRITRINDEIIVIASNDTAFSSSGIFIFDLDLVLKKSKSLTLGINNIRGVFVEKVISGYLVVVSDYRTYNQINTRFHSLSDSLASLHTGARFINNGTQAVGGPCTGVALSGSVYGKAGIGLITYGMNGNSYEGFLGSLVFKVSPLGLVETYTNVPTLGSPPSNMSINAGLYPKKNGAPIDDASMGGVGGDMLYGGNPLSQKSGGYAVGVEVKFDIINGLVVTDIFHCGTINTVGDIYSNTGFFVPLNAEKKLWISASFSSPSGFYMQVYLATHRN